ncbi:MAG: hypothetical protein AAB626_00280 [Patescibacteria group bacterium]
MVKQACFLLAMVFIGIVVYGVFERPELAMWRDALLALLKNLFK